LGQISRFRCPLSARSLNAVAHVRAIEKGLTQCHSKKRIAPQFGIGGTFYSALALGGWGNGNQALLPPKNPSRLPNGLPKRPAFLRHLQANELASKLPRNTAKKCFSERSPRVSPQDITQEYCQETGLSKPGSSHQGLAIGKLHLNLGSTSIVSFLNCNDLK
jgi:hypothetical protein